MAIQGLVDSADFLDSARPQDWRQGIMLNFPNGGSPLTALTTLMRKEKTVDPQFNWHEKNWNPQRIKLDQAIDDSETDFDVDEIDSEFGGYTQLKIGDLLYIEQTGEICRATATPSSANVTVERGIGGTSGTAIADIDAADVNPYITIIGSAYPEGADVPDAVSYNPLARDNYTQIFRTPLSVTRTAMHTKLRTGDQVKEAKREALQMHGQVMERGFIWGTKGEDTSTYEHPIRYTQGVVELIADEADADHTHDFAGGDIDLGDLEAELAIIFKYGSDEKLAFCGNTFLLTIQQIIRRNTGTPYILQQGQKEYGMNVNRLMCPFGTLVLKRHPLFNAMPGGTNPVGGGTFRNWDSAAVILDLEYIRYRYLEGGDTRYLRDRQGNGIDGKTSEYLTECGLEVRFANAHGVWKGLTSAVAES